MHVQQVIEAKIQSLQPAFFEVVNESYRHNVPAGSESHFKIIIVSDQFQGKKLLERHRLINDLLAEELAQTIHALTLHPMTTAEWIEKSGETKVSPPCLGGSRSQQNGQ